MSTHMSGRRVASLGNIMHQIPTVKMHAPLVGCEAEKAIKYAIGDEFCFTTKQAGVVEKID